MRVVRVRQQHDHRIGVDVGARGRDSSAGGRRIDFHGNVALQTSGAHEKSSEAGMECDELPIAKLAKRWRRNADANWRFAGGNVIGGVDSRDAQRNAGARNRPNDIWPGDETHCGPNRRGAVDEETVADRALDAV